MTAYATTEEAYAYADLRKPITIASVDLERYLTIATDMMDALRYTGTLVSGQERKFPRVEDEGIIPTGIKNACIENALSLIDGIDVDLEYENLTMISQSYANIRSTYDRSTVPAHIAARIPSLAAWRLMQPFLPDPREIGFNSIRS